MPPPGAVMVPMRPYGRFSESYQRVQGTWWLPKSVLLEPGTINCARLLRHRAAVGDEGRIPDTGQVDLRGSVDALACWGLLAPFAYTLLAATARHASRHYRTRRGR
jgi:hypothetical protein